MNRIFEISIHIMGDTEPKEVQVFYSANSQEYELGFLKETENPRVKFSEDGKIVQTAGTPLDSNTLHDVSEQIKNVINL
ncbi:hypothetical protein [Pedobacter arcticus]|uniref:hypothetical protein n=1 Tax=Pedobacter arcticus TaxID=752140 RepID=UPI00035EAFD8|nr:hypothetical protein [Pedobacter arcticus]